MALRFAKITPFVEPKQDNKRKQALAAELDAGLQALADEEDEKKKGKDKQSLAANLIPSKQKITMKSKQNKKGLNKRQEAMYA